MFCNWLAVMGWTYDDAAAEGGAFLHIARYQHHLRIKRHGRKR